MEERKHRFDNKEKEEIYPIIKTNLQKLFTGNFFEGLHIFTPSVDIPDDTALRLVVLSPEYPYNKDILKFLQDKVNETLKKRGDKPRIMQNRLLFLVSDQQVVIRLVDQIKTMLSWKSIIDDVNQMRLNLDQIQLKQAEKHCKNESDKIQGMVKEAYKWIMAPIQDIKPDANITDIKWETKAINTAGASMTDEIKRSLKEEEIVIFEWSPIHLNNLLNKWFWKENVKEIPAMDIWNKMCTYLYLPRLSEVSIYKNTISAGVGSRDFFAFAYGKENEKYKGFNYGKPGSVITDDSLLLIDPVYAKEIEQQYEVEKLIINKDPEKHDTPCDTDKDENKDGDDETKKPEIFNKKRFYGTIQLDPVQAKYQFSQIVDEVIQHFTTLPEVKVTISVDIQAQTNKGFSESVQRIVGENAKTLKFKDHGFEDE